MEAFDRDETIKTLQEENKNLADEWKRLTHEWKRLSLRVEEFERRVEIISTHDFARSASEAELKGQVESILLNYNKLLTLTNAMCKFVLRKKKLMVYPQEELQSPEEDSHELGRCYYHMFLPD